MKRNTRIAAIVGGFTIVASLFAFVSTGALRSPRARVSDVAVIMVGPIPALPGETVVEQVQMLNNGSLPAPNTELRVTVPAPALITYAMIPGGAGTCTFTNHEAKCRVSSLPVAKVMSANVYIQMPSVCPAAPVVITGTIRSGNPDPVPTNNTATKTRTVNCGGTTNNADISVSLTGPATALPSGTILYQATLQNAGPSRVTAAVLTVPLIGLTFQPAVSDPSCRLVLNVVKCSNIALDLNEQKTVTIGLRVPTLRYQSVYTQVVTVAHELTDPVPANNTSNAVRTTITTTAPVEVRADITGRSLGTTDTAVKNQQNVNLQRFDIWATGKDLLFSQVIFTAQAGSLNNAQNYTLWVDTNADTVVDTVLQEGVFAAGGKVTFNNMRNGGHVIPKDASSIYEVHADIASNLTNNQLQLAFAVTDPAYVKLEALDIGTALVGIRTNGVCSVASCQIVVITVPSKQYSLVSSGDLYVSHDTTPVRNRQFLGGALGETALRLNFHAENEDIDVTYLQISNLGSTASSIDRLELYRDGTSAPFATASVGSCGSDQTPAGVTTFCAQMESRQLIVQKGTHLDVLLRPRMKSDVERAVPAQLIQLFIDERAISNNATGEGAVRARGGVSSNSLSANNGNSTADGEVFIGRTSVNATNARITGPQHASVLSKITSILNANPDANGTSVPSGVSPIGQFKITAAPHSNSQNGLNKVTLSDIIFNVTATNVNLNPSNFKFYNKANADATAKRACTTHTAAGVAIAGTASGVLLVRCQNLIGTVSTTIDQGRDLTFVLEGDITNPKTSASTSTLQVTLQDFSSMANTTFGPTTSHFQWRDADNAAATTADFLWVDYPATVIGSTIYSS